MARVLSVAVTLMPPNVWSLCTQSFSECNFFS